jgi:hypothetical protein
MSERLDDQRMATKIARGGGRNGALTESGGGCEEIGVQLQPQQFDCVERCWEMFSSNATVAAPESGDSSLEH